MSLREQAYYTIRQKIVSLELQPGETIDEAKLQSMLDLGRTPIREALLRLSQERLVNIVPRRGMFVTEIGMTDLRQLFEIRYTLESLAVEYAAERGTARHWQQMEDALNSIPEAGMPDENTIMISVDEQCHQIIYEAANNQFLQDTLTTWYVLSLRLWYFFLKDIGPMRSTIEEHRTMLAALKNQDSDQAVAIMLRHITTFQEEIQSAMVGKIK